MLTIINTVMLSCILIGIGICLYAMYKLKEKEEENTNKTHKDIETTNIIIKYVQKGADDVNSIINYMINDGFDSKKIQSVINKINNNKKEIE